MKTPRSTDATPTATDDDFGGDTKAHYMPNEPRPPASSRDEIAEIAALLAPTAQVMLHRAVAPSASVDAAIPVEVEEPEVEIVHPAEAPQLLQLPQLPIAEMFQETLWRAYRAGALSADPSYEAFASWYAKDVLG